MLIIPNTVGWVYLAVIDVELGHGEFFGWGSSTIFGVNWEPLSSPNDFFSKSLSVWAMAVVVLPTTVVLISLRRSCAANVLGQPPSTVSIEYASGWPILC